MQAEMQPLDEARGNPLTLLELPRGLTATQRAGGFGLVDARALPGQPEGTIGLQITGTTHLFAADGSRIATTKGSLQ